MGNQYDVLFCSQGIVVAVAGSVPVVRYSRADSANCSLALGAVSACATNDEAAGRGCPSAEDLGEGSRRFVFRRVRFNQRHGDVVLPRVFPRDVQRLQRMGPAERHAERVWERRDGWKRVSR